MALVRVDKGHSADDMYTRFYYYQTGSGGNYTIQEGIYSYGCDFKYQEVTSSSTVVTLTVNVNSNGDKMTISGSASTGFTMVCDVAGEYSSDGTTWTALAANTPVTLSGSENPLFHNWNYFRFT